MSWIDRFKIRKDSKSEPLVTDLTNLDTEARLSGLEQILTLALGDRIDDFGVPDSRLAELELPYPLKRFYRFAGRWSSPHPDRSPIIYEDPEEAYFYVGIQSAHLATVDSLEITDNRRIQFAWEHSGNWVAKTEAMGDDPPVWVQEALGRDNYGEPVESGERLSGWIVSHCLMALSWETGNSYLCATLDRSSNSKTHSCDLTRWLENERTKNQRLWKSAQSVCPELSGEFCIVGDGLLIHQLGDLTRISALTPIGANELKALGGSNTDFE